MDVLRHVGRAELSSFLGASPASRAMDADQMAAAPYTEADLEAQIEAPADSGDRSACRSALWWSLADASAAPEAEFGSAEVADRQRVPADDAIVASAVGVRGVRDIDWQNRPTFQQVVQLPPPYAGGGDGPGQGNGGPPDDAGPREALGPPEDARASGGRVRVASAGSVGGATPATSELAVGLAGLLLALAARAMVGRRRRRRTRLTAASAAEGWSSTAACPAVRKFHRPSGHRTPSTSTPFRRSVLSTRTLSAGPAVVASTLRGRNAGTGPRGPQDLLGEARMTTRQRSCGPREWALSIRTDSRSA